MRSAGTMSPREALVNNVLRGLRGRYYRWRGPRFGVREALLWSTALDVWHRYAALMEDLEGRLAPDSHILEVGPGSFGLEFFLSPPHRRRLVQLDIVPRPLHRIPDEGSRLLASGTALPVRDASFDFVVAMDVLEHVPKNLRSAFAVELKRVTRGTVFLHLPLESEDGNFQAAQSDEAFQGWYADRFGQREPNIQEHLAHGHPTPTDLEEAFPGISLRGTVSVEDWRWYMTQERLASRRAFVGLLRRLRGRCPGPPFYGALAVWEVP